MSNVNPQSRRFVNWFLPDGIPLIPDLIGRKDNSQVLLDRWNYLSYARERKISAHVSVEESHNLHLEEFSLCIRKERKRNGRAENGK